ncbi:Alkane hydroxylase MAH1 [Carex littledalei]|uniref:Alkane hydroxylase MAH1 n=1 Tax=Carex littledalei TaxID=544730 RepID=A0A833RM01_9POAL|nr:Alkane hydroxylase MAH1 [Carex littledalei]
MAWAWFAFTDLILCIPCLLFLYYLYNNFLVSHPPVNFPIVGMLPSLLANVQQFHDWIANSLLVNGNLYFRGPWFSGMEYFFTSDPANVHHIFTQNFQNYPKGGDFLEIFEVLGDGIFNTDGDSWRFQREKLQLAMSQKSFRTFIAKTTRDKIENALLPFFSQTVEHDRVIDLQDMFSRLSFDMSCILSFGTDPGSLSMDLPVVPFGRAVDDASAAIFYRVSRPAVFWKLLKFLGIGQEKKLAKARVVIDQFIAEAIEKRKHEMNEGKHVCPDLLSSYLNDEDIPNSNEFLRDSVLTFLTAGRDTISSGLSWFFWALSQNRQTEENILRELSSARQNITPKGMITFDPEELDNLVYFKAAFMESLRLFPPVPLNFKAVLKPDILPSGFTLWKGMLSNLHCPLAFDN